MKRVLVILSVAFMALAMISCEANEETYNKFKGSWHLVRINDDGEYRMPNPNLESCFNINFLANNSMMGQSVESNFSAIYNIRKNNKIVWSGFSYIPPEPNDSTDNILFMENIIKTESYELNGDTLKLLYDDKVYLKFEKR